MSRWNSRGCLASDEGGYGAVLAERNMDRAESDCWDWGEWNMDTVG